ncbi:hypothetical protein ACUXVY_16160 [Chromobacterium haemolyticum]|jgi:hypothetical protein
MQQLNFAPVPFRGATLYLAASAGTAGEVELKGNKVEVTMAGNPAELV